jgi:hypothetical protein
VRQHRARVARCQRGQRQPAAIRTGVRAPRALPRSRGGILPRPGRAPDPRGGEAVYSGARMQRNDSAEITRQLAELRLQHRDLDAAISQLQSDIANDELTIKRLKKRKLALKDLIARLESALIPDEPA